MASDFFGRERLIGLCLAAEPSAPTLGCDYWEHPLSAGGNIGHSSGRSTAPSHAFGSQLIYFGNVYVALLASASSGFCHDCGVGSCHALPLCFFPVMVDSILLVMAGEV